MNSDCGTPFRWMPVASALQMAPKCRRAEPPTLLRASPAAASLAATEIHCDARCFGEACEALARTSVTRLGKCRRRLGEDPALRLAGSHTSDKWSTDPPVAALAPPGERPDIPRNLALDCLNVC